MCLDAWPTGNDFIRRCDLVEWAWPCWRKCVTVGVGFKALKTKLHPVQKRQSHSDAFRPRCTTLSSFSSTTSAVMIMD